MAPTATHSTSAPMSSASTSPRRLGSIGPSHRSTRHPTPVTSESPTMTTRRVRLRVRVSPLDESFLFFIILCIDVDAADTDEGSSFDERRAVWPSSRSSRGRTLSSKNSRASSRAFISASPAGDVSARDLPPSIFGEATPRVGPRASGRGSYRACSAHACAPAMPATPAVPTALHRSAVEKPRRAQPAMASASSSEMAEYSNADFDSLSNARLGFRLLTVNFSSPR